MKRLFIDQSGTRNTERGTRNMERFSTINRIRQLFHCFFQNQS